MSTKNNINNKITDHEFIDISIENGLENSGHGNKKYSSTIKTDLRTN